MLKIFIGYDKRQPVAYNVLQYSILKYSSQPVSITPLVISQLPLKRIGLTDFTFSRFLVPYLCDYQGWALFLDADMMVLSDITELFAYANSRYAIMVIKNKLQFEWASLMLMNCEKCKKLTPEFIEQSDQLFSFEWTTPDTVGALPAQWNHLVGYDVPNPDAKLIHFTRGMPCYPTTKNIEHGQTWRDMHRASNQIATLESLLGHSVHYSENQTHQTIK